MTSDDGVEIRGSSVRIKFYYRNKRRSVTLKGLKASKSNIKFAQRKRDSILYEIERGTFVWEEHFQQAPPADIAGVKTNPVHRLTVAQALDQTLEWYKQNRAPSTVTGYRTKMLKIRRRFGIYPLLELSPNEIADWISQDLSSLNNKTINEILIPFRRMIRRVQKDCIHFPQDSQHFNVILNELSPLEIPETDSEPDPFTLAEYQRIEALSTHRVQEKNLILFGCNSGLAKSELIALGWEDIDLAAWTGVCQKALVEGGYKVTKNKRRRRQLEFLEQAVEILKAQKALTYMLPPIEIEVLLRDNRNYKAVQHRPVFRNSVTGNPIASDNSFNSEILDPLLRVAKVRGRGMNCVRHSFISRMLTLGMEKEWIITQTGHGTARMLEKHYGTWINDDRPSMAREASRRLRELQEESP